MPSLLMGIAHGPARAHLPLTPCRKLRVSPSKADLPFLGFGATALQAIEHSKPSCEAVCALAIELSEVYHLGEVALFLRDMLACSRP